MLFKSTTYNIIYNYTSCNINIITMRSVVQLKDYIILFILITIFIKYDNYKLLFNSTRIEIIIEYKYILYKLYILLFYLMIYDHIIIFIIPI